MRLFNHVPEVEQFEFMQECNFDFHNKLFAKSDLLL